MTKRKKKNKLNSGNLKTWYSFVNNVYYCVNNISKNKAMKKLLFLFTFTFIVGQAFSQMYIVTYTSVSSTHDANCNPSAGYDRVLTTVDPAGAVSYICIQESSVAQTSNSLVVINQQFNSIINQGYKLIETNSPNGSTLTSNTKLVVGTMWYFAIPWTSNGLEEVATTLKSFIISPNPANTFIDITLDYSLKGESQVIFISEAGYISHKQSVGIISKSEKHNIDISKVPAGKYLVTIVNGKTYTTPQKLVVIR